MQPGPQQPFSLDFSSPVLFDSPSLFQITPSATRDGTPALPTPSAAVITGIEASYASLEAEAY